jgi:cation diffusion facilitator CzcD-associated flavoprotein CzcO
VAKQLPPGVPVDPHFAPRYAPWDQRLCVVPDGDFFAALRSGQASVVTATIDTFTEKGIRLDDGTELAADIVVTATGLSMVAFGEMALEVDGRAVDSGALHVYKGMMFDGVPNLAWCVGYTNASWTLRADLSNRYLCRLLNYLDRHAIDIATPAMDPAESAPEPLMDLRSGYVRRAAGILPRQGTRGMWRMRNNYFVDLPRMRFSRIDDGAMTFTRITTGA